MRFIKAHLWSQPAMCSCIPGFSRQNPLQNAWHTIAVWTNRVLADSLLMLRSTIRDAQVDYFAYNILRGLRFGVFRARDFGVDSSPANYPRFSIM